MNLLLNDIVQLIDQQGGHEFSRISTHIHFKCPSIKGAQRDRGDEAFTCRNEKNGVTLKARGEILELIFENV